MTEYSLEWVRLDQNETKAEYLKRMYAVLFGVDINIVRAGLIVSMLGRCTDRELVDAVTHMGRTCVYKPSIANLINSLKHIRGQDTESLEERGCMAYGDLSRRMSAHHDVVVSDGRIGYAVRCMGGWASFCRSDAPEDLHRKEFAKHYARCTPDKETHVLHAFADTDRPAVYFIGDKTVCMSIAQEHYKECLPRYQNADRPQLPPPERRTCAKDEMSDEDKAMLTQLKETWLRRK